MENSNYYRFDGALKRLGGDEELFQELMSYFIEDAPELLKTIEAGLAAGSAESIRRAAHSLRGLAANFDAEEAMAIACSIEQMASKGDLQPVPSALAHLAVEVRSLRDVLGGYTTPPKARRTPPPTRSPIERR